MEAKKSGFMVTRCVLDQTVGVEVVIPQITQDQSQRKESGKPAHYYER